MQRCQVTVADAARFGCHLLLARPQTIRVSRGDPQLHPLHVNQPLPPQQLIFLPLRSLNKRHSFLVSDHRHRFPASSSTTAATKHRAWAVTRFVPFPLLFSDTGCCREAPGSEKREANTDSDHLSRKT